MTRRGQVWFTVAAYTQTHTHTHTQTQTHTDTHTHTQVWFTVTTYESNIYRVADKVR
jgi:hypothetical protein